MDEKMDKEENLIKQLIPKITEYFTKNKNLEKGKLKEFLEFINFQILDENNNIETFWKEISKNSNGKNITKEFLIKNLVEYIHNHNKELFEKESSLMSSVRSFIDRPVKLIEDIDGDNELIFEFYRLLATIDLTNAQDVPLLSLENALNEYKFINLTNDSISEILEDLLKEKTKTIKKYDFLEIMEKMSKEYLYKLENIAQRKLAFNEEDMETPELKDFIYLLNFVNILLKISDSAFICHEKSIKVVQNKDVLNTEYLNRNFFVLINNMKLYIYEIMRIYHEQKQKFDYFLCTNISKITILKQQNKNLEEQLRAKDNDDNDKILKALYDEIKIEKNKSDDLFKENQNLKEKISNNNNKIYEYDNKIQEMNKVLKENEGKINILTKEKELQNEKYRNVFDQLNSFLLTKKEKERRLSESVKKMNLSNNLLHLVNMEKADIISLFNEKDKHFSSIEKDNKTLKNKIIELEKNAEKYTEEIELLKNRNNSLNKKNEALQKEIQDSKKEIEEQAEKSFFLSSVIDDKVDKEDYDDLENQFNQEKEKNLKLKKKIDQLNEQISQKEEEIIKTKNKTNSQENIIKENENKINNLNDQLNKNKDKYNELLKNYNNILAKIEEDERKLKNDIDNLNLSEKYQKFINMEKPELIKFIIDKDTYIEKIQNENSSHKNKIKDLNNLKQELEEEINKNKTMINNLNKNITSLENELKEANSSKAQLEKNLNEKEAEIKKEKYEKEKLDDNLSNEKKKNELLMNDNKNMKNEIISQKENISKANNEISSLQNKNKEKEEQINSLTKEKDILSKNYKDLLDKYNEQLANTKQKEEIASMAIQNLNLTGEYLKLANMSKDQLISLIIEKDKYLKMTEDLNKDLNEKIEKINNEKNLVDDECNKLKLKIVDLEKNNSLLNQDIEHINKDLENVKTDKNNLISDLDKEKTQKEKYIKESESLKEQIKELNININNLKNDIQKLNEENLSKDDSIAKLENKISSMQSLINNLEKQKSDLSNKYSELIDKSNSQLEKINNFNLKEKTELDLISKLNLSNEYQFLSSKTKADLISLIIEKDNLNKKLEEEKNELNNKISGLDKIKIELEKNLADFEAKNNTLNNKIKNLENEINTMKNEIENLQKEKSELNNLLKEEKKSGEKMKTANDLLNKENTKIDILNKENKKLSEEIINLKDIITKTNDELSLNKKNLEEKENINNNLTKELEALNTQYNDLLNNYNSQKLFLENKEKAKEEALKDIEEKYKYLKDLSIEELVKIIIEKDKLYLTAQEEINNNKNENSKLSQRNKKLEEYLTKSKDLKQKYLTLLEKYKESQQNNENLIKERDEYKNKYDKLLEAVVKKDKEKKIFKNNLLALINTSQFVLKKQVKIKKINYQEEKMYDYLCLRLERKIIDSLKDSHYDGKTVFTEAIKYIIDEKENIAQECIAFITMEYFYLYNYNYKCCFASPLIELNLFSISNTSNYVALFFQRSEDVIFETFRVLELVNFMKLIKARQKSFKFVINSEPYIYTKPNEIKKTNYIESLYYGKASFSGNFKKQIEGIFTVNYEERFGVLCEIGLIILESPTGKPKEIINLLFADISGFNTREGNNGLAINVRGKIHKLAFESDKIRNEWENKIKYWKKNNSLLTKF